tara:strand:- start:109 stop:564 length:456 start_codon:yes stop_codon:yes gene_type:complete
MKTKPKILIVESRFYSEISDHLLLGARKELDSENILYDVTSVPGTLEVAQAISIIKNKRKDASADIEYDGYIALGCVIRGETSHYDYVCAESMRSLNYLAIKYDLCLGNGILTCENIEQAQNRARVDMGNKGGDAAKASLALLRLKKPYRP